MGDKPDDAAPHARGQGEGQTAQQEQGSQQSLNNPAPPDSQPIAASARKDRQSPPGVGSSQGQDGGTSGSSGAWPSAGTPDIERPSAESQDSGPDGSMVNDSTGAFKERP